MKVESNLHQSHQGDVHSYRHLHWKLLRNDACDDHHTFQQQLMSCLFLLLETNFHDICCADECKNQQNQ